MGWCVGEKPRSINARNDKEKCSVVIVEIEKETWSNTSQSKTASHGNTST
jgi:phenylpyruvate tautomerase PptA (4-oxalocrotonate tautomerase family)